MQSDNGMSFTPPDGLCGGVVEAVGVQKTRSNGQSEKTNGSILSPLRILMLDN